MPFTSRVFRLLESELNKNLSFTFCIEGGSRHGRPPMRFSFAVSIRNDSLIAMKKVRGTITPSAAAAFRTATFNLPNLGPHQQCEIARIEAHLLERPDDTFSFDRIATVNVVGQADLSGFWFRDSNRPLTYVKQALPLVKPESSEQPLIERFEREPSNPKPKSWSPLTVPRMRRATGET